MEEIWREITDAIIDMKHLIALLSIVFLTGCGPGGLGHDKAPMDWRQSLVDQGPQLLCINREVPNTALNRWFGEWGHIDGCTVWSPTEEYELGRMAWLWMYRMGGYPEGCINENTKCVLVYVRSIPTADSHYIPGIQPKIFINTSDKAMGHELGHALAIRVGEPWHHDLDWITAWGRGQRYLRMW